LNRIQIQIPPKGGFHACCDLRRIASAPDEGRLFGEEGKMKDQPRTDVDELEPTILGEVTEVTGAGSGSGEPNIVWGTD
jgi:hypothetical protein